MDTSAKPVDHQKAIIGNLDHDYWIWDSESGYDLTRSFRSQPERPGTTLTLKTTKANVRIDPAKSVLVIIDMQNFYLSTALGRPAGSKGLIAERQILEHAIPAARKAGIQIAWLNWGLTEEDLRSFPPAEVRAFGFTSMSAEDFDKRYEGKTPSNIGEDKDAARQPHNDLGKNARIYKGVGQSLGPVYQSGGRQIDAGRMLMREQWNTLLSPPLQEEYEASLCTSRPDIILDKIRISGMHTPETSTSKYLREQGFKTLLFGGVNTDQCVNATLADAFCQGFDCILLSDGCATTSPAGAHESVVNNVAGTLGFVLTCEDFAESANKVSP